MDNPSIVLAFGFSVPFVLMFPVMARLIVKAPTRSDKFALSYTVADLALLTSGPLIIVKKVIVHSRFLFT